MSDEVERIRALLGTGRPKTIDTEHLYTLLAALDAATKERDNQRKRAEYVIRCAEVERLRRHTAGADKALRRLVPQVKRLRAVARRMSTDDGMCLFCIGRDHEENCPLAALQLGDLGEEGGDDGE